MAYRYHVRPDAGPSEERFRALLDDNGILRQRVTPSEIDAEGLPTPPPSSELISLDPANAFTVFSQRKDARLDIAELRHQAARFFATKVGLTVEKRYDAGAPLVDAARIVVASDDGTATGTRLCFGRPAETEDVAEAEAAERRTRGTGMALLAQRCPILWRIAIEAVGDRAALTIAAIFASVYLGPILSPDGELFGVRTARLKLEAASSPYR